MPPTGGLAAAAAARNNGGMRRPEGQSRSLVMTKPTAERAADGGVGRVGAFEVQVGVIRVRRISRAK